MPTVNQVKIISNTAGAPALTNSTSLYSDGSFKAFLTYALQQAGWTLISQSTYISVLKNAKETTFIRIQNDGNYQYTTTSLGGISSLTVSFGSGYDSGNPLVTPLTNNKNFYINTSYSQHLAGGIQGVVYGNENSFYLGFINTANSALADLFFAGDIVPFDILNISNGGLNLALNAQNNFLVIMGEDTSARPYPTNVNNSSGSVYNMAGVVLQKDVRQIQGWHRGGLSAVLPSQVTLGTGGLSYPNFLGKIDIDKVIVADNAQRRGYLAGARASLQDLSFSLFDTVQTYNQSVARDFEYIKMSSGGILIETSNTWYD